MRPPAVPDLRKSSGAFDMPSILTGVVVVGILAAGVLAAIFGVIPYAQNNGAKQDLSAIRTAEGAAKAKDNRFMDHSGLLDTGYLQLSSTKQTKVMADEKGTCYVALAKSGTGKIFYSTDANTDPELFEADTDPGCLPAEKLAELIDSVGGIDTPKGAPANLKLTAVSPLQAKATWDKVKGANGYKVEYRVGDSADWAVKHEKTLNVTVNISALPEQVVAVRVSALKGEEVSEPSIASVKLPDSTLKNPSFEEGNLHWNVPNGINSTEARAHTGTKSMAISSGGPAFSQTVTIPDATPVLTFWANKQPEVSISGATPAVVVVGGSTEDGWTQYKSDLSAFAGKTVSISFTTPGTYVDDVALEAPMVPNRPTGVAASSHNSTATVTWVAPVFGGGTPISEYNVTAWQGDQKKDTVKVPGDRRTATLTGVKNSESYSFTVTAVNEKGDSDPSAAFGPVTVIEGAIANPGFELGLSGWKTVAGYSDAVSTASTDKAHSGTQSMRGVYQNGWGMSGISQVVNIPDDMTALTYWSTMKLITTVGGATVAAVPGGTEGGWTKYRVDVSAYSGKTVNISFVGDGSGAYYLDDVSLEGSSIPDSPTSIGASSREGSVTVTWAAPQFSGGNAVTAYKVTAWQDGKPKTSIEVGGSARQATLADVAVGSAYTFTVAARNDIGFSEQSASFGPVEILSGAFANPSFEYGASGWTLTGRGSSAKEGTARTGTKALNGYYSNGWGSSGASQAVYVPADKTVLTYWSTAKVEVTTSNVKLFPIAMATEGAWTQYKINVSAYAGKTATFSFVGDGAANYYLDDVDLKAVMVPDEPTAVGVSSREGTATVTWTAPAFTGGSAINGYEVVARQGGKDVTAVSMAGTLRTATLSGLRTGESYTFVVKAENKAGSSHASQAFGPVEITNGPLANPGFEGGSYGWVHGTQAVASTAAAHSGTQSLRTADYYTYVTQTANIPGGTTTMTYWTTTGNAKVEMGNTSVASKLVSTEGIWKQYEVNMTAYAGKTASIRFTPQTYSAIYFDDIALH